MLSKKQPKFLLAHFELNETPDNIENDYDLLDIQFYFY